MKTKSELKGGTAPAGLDSSLLLLFLEKMLLIRQFEGKIAEFTRKGIFRGSIHFSTGEEATAVGACCAVEAHDYILPTHRGHGQELAKGSDPARLMAEIIGKETGLCKGRGGTLHIFDREHNILGSQAILGAQFPIAVGVGLAIKLKGLAGTTVLCFTGDGTTNEGTFYEAMSAAALWKLPVIFVCVNNVYGMGMKYDETCRTPIEEKGTALKIPSVTADGNDVQAVFRVMKDVVNAVKSEGAPALVELRTYRVAGHSVNDHHEYRTQEEVEEWRKQDPIERLTAELLAGGVTREQVETVSQRVARAVSEAETFALDSPYPRWDESCSR
jgi:acetoin:2,6-dichlorophenolindophenol oxidoreductase subunit alpha